MRSSACGLANIGRALERNQRRRLRCHPRCIRRDERPINEKTADEHQRCNRSPDCESGHRSRPGTASNPLTARRLRGGRNRRLVGQYRKRELGRVRHGPDNSRQRAFPFRGRRGRSWLVNRGFACRRIGVLEEGRTILTEDHLNAPKAVQVRFGERGQAFPVHRFVRRRGGWGPRGERDIAARALLRRSHQRSQSR